MKLRNLFLGAVIAVLAFAFAPKLFVPAHASPASSESVLTGAVKSASGEKMAGVTVSAKAEGATITTTVFTDEDGNYYFPPMPAGQYKVWAQADTFETSHASVALSDTEHQDFVLKPLADFERQLTGDQLLASLPDQTPEDRHMKRIFRNSCTSCHQPNYILQNRFDADGWTSVMDLMKRVNVAGGF